MMWRWWHWLWTEEAGPGTGLRIMWILVNVFMWGFVLVSVLALLAMIGRA
jgi:hypothetical protein